MPVDIEKLKTISYFSSLNDTELELIKYNITESIFEKSSVIEFEGETSEYLYFVITGIVKVFKTSFNGKDQILHFASVGDPLNDVSTFDGGSNAATMLALTNVSLYAIKKEALKGILCSYQRVCLNIIQSLATRARRDASLIQELHADNAQIRLAKLLLGIYAGEKGTVVMQLTQNDMASILGTCREIINRSLKVMEKKGAIKIAFNKTMILDKRILSEFAQSSDGLVLNK